MAGFAVYLLVLGIRHFVRGFRQGLRGGGGPDRPNLRGVLFRTVLVTLLVLFLLWTALLEQNQQGQRWPVTEGGFELRNAQSHGATWLDSDAQTAIEAALKEAVGGNPGSSGELNLGRTAELQYTPLTPSAIRAAYGARDGLGVGAGQVAGEAGHYVAWRTSKNRAVFYGWVTPPWYENVLQYGFMLVFGVAILSPFAAVAAWYLNRRIVKPVQQVADASVVLAEGGEPMPIPTKAPRELSCWRPPSTTWPRGCAGRRTPSATSCSPSATSSKTPLTAIDGYAELLADGAVEPKQAADVLGLESARLRRLIGDLLDLARIDRSEFTVVDEPVDLAVTAREAVARFEGLAETLGVALVADAAGPALARGDAGRLLQVASNLVENALRATGSGGRVEVVARPGQLSVRDTGPGLTEKDLDHAFERFYLHRKYSTGPAVGTGLGLAIVKDLAEAMGGSVVVESEPGAGSTFTIALPVLAPSATPTDA